MRLLAKSLTVFLPYLCYGQVVSSTPLFPYQNDSITLTYDASLGNGELVGITPVFVHTVPNFITPNGDNVNDGAFQRTTNPGNRTYP